MACDSVSTERPRATEKEQQCVDFYLPLYYIPPESVKNSEKGTRTVMDGKQNKKTLDYHLSLRAREKYNLRRPIFTSDLGPLPVDNRALYTLAEKMNEDRDLISHPESSVDASELRAFNLIDEIMHFVLAKHCAETNPNELSDLFAAMQKTVGAEPASDLLLQFTERFPPPPVLEGNASPDDFIHTKTPDGVSGHEASLEELILLWTEAENPAARNLKELVDPNELTDHTALNDAIAVLARSLGGTDTALQPGKSLLDLMTEPAQRFPDSLLDQLRFMTNEWGVDIGDFRTQVLRCIDFLEETHRARFDPALFGPGPTHVASFSGAEFEPEQFSADKDWMPHVILMAKNAYVWLHQLSRQYQRDIRTLDAIPDEELDRLAQSGFTSLWLIGIWRRSTASRRIKQIMGNPEAAASAYSLKSYDIADDIGGYAAYENLKQRAWQRHIRLACDMVPNHMGIDSDWVAEHPDWFIGGDEPPFPSYSFNGENLSDDPRMSVYIEDGYWNHSDAAVVFKRVDNATGHASYIYHGNDGTHLPWNDTAQLNYLLAHVREAVMQTILHVARMFPIIRFDAAMTLAKKHYHRLWFPEPGSGGDIPSRSWHGTPRTAFDDFFPNEFWREVVDRVSEEVPDTLLLAEAFWLMEGYFVRTLGMHRVYNSAFMHMLRDEDNAKYRESIRNVLEFDPRILERHVNFMSNPDEATAIEQFGDGDKYFGTCIVLVTMPGLPMFGHGQIEGFSEKYGMEYRRAYYEESINEGLGLRHSLEIYPLLRKRRLFSGAENFRLYDVAAEGGGALDDVLAYSNRLGRERCLVLYHNRFADANGCVRMSVAHKTASGGTAHTRVTDGLGIGHGDQRYVIFKDHISGLEYIISCNEVHERGIPVHLGAYKAQVFMDIREIESSDARPYAALAQKLGWQGIPSIEEALDEMICGPLVTTLEEGASPEQLRSLVNELVDASSPQDLTENVTTFLHSIVDSIAAFEDVPPPSKSDIETQAEFLLAMAQRAQVSSPQAAPTASTPVAGAPKGKARRKKAAPASLPAVPFTQSNLDGWRVLIALPALSLLRGMYRTHKNETLRLRFLEERFILRVLQRTFEELGASGDDAWADTRLLALLTMDSERVDIASATSDNTFYRTMFSSVPAQRYLGVNRHENAVYFNKERFETLLAWLVFLATPKPATKESQDTILTRAISAIALASKSGYEVKAFLTPTP